MLVTCLYQCIGRTSPRSDRSLRYCTKNKHPEVHQSAAYTPRTQPRPHVQALEGQPTSPSSCSIGWANQPGSSLLPLPAQSTPMELHGHIYCYCGLSSMHVVVMIACTLKPCVNICKVHSQLLDSSHATLKLRRAYSEVTRGLLWLSPCSSHPPERT